MERFTRGQLQLVNDMKKKLGQDIIWKFFEYLRVEDEIDMKIIVSAAVMACNQVVVQVEVE